MNHRVEARLIAFAERRLTLSTEAAGPKVAAALPAERASADVPRGRTPTGTDVEG